MDKIADLLLDAICVVDAHGVFEYISPAGETIFGYRPEEMVGRPMTDFIAPFDLARTLSAARNVMEGRPHLHFENCYVRKDGQLVHLMWSARRANEDQKRVAVARDVSALKYAEASQTALLAISEAAHESGDVVELIEKIHTILASLMPVPDFSVLIQEAGSPHLRVAYPSPPSPQVDEVEGFLYRAVMEGKGQLLLTPQSLLEHFPGWSNSQTPPWCCWLGVPLGTPSGRVGALVLKRYAGDLPWSDKQCALLQYVSTQIATAIERKALYAKLRRMAQFDALTGLPNRYLLSDRLDGAIARAERNQTGLALLFVDLNKFKAINDSLGHTVGDLVLQEVGRRLSLGVRDADTVARLGGDEFVVLLEGVTDLDSARQVADKLRDELLKPMQLGAHALTLSSSIGVAHYPAHGVTADQLLRQADVAMYDDKKYAERSC